MFRKVAIICLMVLSCTNTQANSELNNLMQQLVASGQIVGGVVGVYEQGKTDYYSFGRTGLSDEKPGKRTDYPIASVTKVFTATLLAEAVVEGKVKLNDLVAGHYGLTYQALATHTASFPSNPPPFIKKPDDVYQRFFQHWKPKHKIGSNYHYSNFAFELLAYQITQIYKQPYQVVLKDNILKPLKMKDTATIVAYNKNKIAKGYHENGQVVNLERQPWNGIGFLVSSARDLMRFAKANLGVQPALQLTHQPYFTRTANLKQGLAWDIHQKNGQTILSKSGGQPGYGAFIGFNPNQNKAIVVVLSKVDNPQAKVVNRVVKVARGQVFG